MGKCFDLRHDEINVGLTLFGRHAGRDRKDVLATGSLAPPESRLEPGLRVVAGLRRHQGTSLANLLAVHLALLLETTLELPDPGDSRIV